MRRINKIKTRYKNTFGSTMGVAALFVGVTLIGISPSARAQNTEGNSLSEKTLPITPGVYAIPGTLPALPPSDPSPPVNTKVLLQPSTPPPDYTKAAKEEEKNYSMTLFDLLEYRPKGADSDVRWDIERWQGGDYNRWWFKTEGTSNVHSGDTDADFQLLKSKLIHPFTEIQYGLRLETHHSGGSTIARPQAVLGFESLMPYSYELETALYIDPHGNISGEAKAEKDFKITQRLILQPRIEAGAALQQVDHFGIGSGLTDMSLGLRLRYEITREFAPYIGITYQKSFGETASFVRQEGGDPSQLRFVTGVKMWF